MLNIGYQDNANFILSSLLHVFRRTAQEVLLISNTVQDQVASSFKNLPTTLRNCKEHKQFSKDTFKYLSSQAKREIM